MLTDHHWRLKYTPEDGDLVRRFYLPALADAARYDRLTGYFNAGALALAARGIEGLVRNAGRMRLVVGCTLAPPAGRRPPRAARCGGRRRAGAAGLDGGARPSRREGGGAVRRGPAADGGRRDLP